ncbi:MAG: hypothetical protein PVF93_10920 [Chromatiaceae bacterium]|jgi:hypothetical protein
MTDVEPGIQGRDENRPALQVACLHPHSRRAALVSTTGAHCTVWRSNRRPRQNEDADGVQYVEYVVKYPRDQYQPTDARILARQHRELRDRLGDIAPPALFVVASIDDQPNLFVIAHAVDIWFNVANPSNREEAIGLLGENPIARKQLRTFVEQAHRWREGANPRVIDLYGLDNLVMDNRRHIRYIDSYYVFFFEDMLHLLGGERDYELEEKISVSLKRLTYLENVLDVAERQASGSD